MEILVDFVANYLCYDCSLMDISETDVKLGHHLIVCSVELARGFSYCVNL